MHIEEHRLPLRWVCCRNNNEEKQAGFSKAKKATESGNEKDKNEWQGNEKGMGNEKEPEQGNRKEVRNQNPRKGNKKALRRHQEDWMER